MKKFALIMALCLPMIANAAIGIEIVKTDGETLQIANADIANLTFVDGNAVIAGTGEQTVSVPCDVISSISPIDAVVKEYSVTFDGASAKVINPYALIGVTTEIDGAYVTTSNANAETELSFALAGSTTDGGYIYNGSYKCTLKLNGVSITSTKGAAVNIQCGKRIAVVLVENTTSNLIDCENGEQKAALYFKGHPEFEKGGTLNVTGRTKHAISAKEYVQIKKSVGAINVLSAVSDGIHAGQYFQMNGGTVTIDNVDGDGIQAELTDDETDENNGQMIIKDGSINVVVSGSTADCLKADALITISGGILNLTTTGNGIVDDTTNAPQMGPGGGPGGGGWGPGPGPGGGSSVETSSAKCINGAGDLTITGGEITCVSTGKGGKGIVCDGILTVDGEEVVINVTTSGAPVSGSGDNANGLAKAIKAEGDIVINNGFVCCTTTKDGGEGIESKSTITINGGTIICNTYDDGLNASQKITFNGGVTWVWASHNDGVDCNGNGGIELNGGIIVAHGASAPEEGFDCDNYPFVINGGTAFGVGGATSNVTKATQPYASTKSVTITKDHYLSMVDASGNVIMSYLCPASLSSATIVSTSPEYGNNTSCKLVTGVTEVSDPTATYMDGRILLGGTITGGTTKNITPKTK